MRLYGNGDIIAIDGLDAAGKDTHASLLYDYFSRNGHRVTCHSHPDERTAAGNVALLSSRKEGRVPYLMTGLFSFIDLLGSYLRVSAEPGIHIFARDLGSLYYLPRSVAEVFYSGLSKVLPEPRIRFFLDVSPEESRKRIANRKKKQHQLEDLESLEECRKRALRFTHGKGYELINTEAPVEDVHRQILAEVERAFDR